MRMQGKKISSEIATHLGNTAAISGSPVARLTSFVRLLTESAIVISATQCRPCTKPRLPRCNTLGKLPIRGYSQGGAHRAIYWVRYACRD